MYINASISTALTPSFLGPRGPEMPCAAWHVMHTRLSSLLVEFVAHASVSHRRVLPRRTQP